MRKFIFLVVLSLVAFHGFSVTTYPAFKDQNRASAYGYMAGYAGALMTVFEANFGESFNFNYACMAAEDKVFKSVDIFLSRPESTNSEEASVYQYLRQGLFYFLEKDKKVWPMVQVLLDKKLIKHPGKPVFPIVE